METEDGRGGHQTVPRVVLVAVSESDVGDVASMCANPNCVGCGL